MFTGLVQELGTVKECARTEEGVRLTVSCPLAAELRAGDSIAVNGVCLTSVTVEDHSFAAEVMNETLARSSLGALVPGHHVNLELPLGATDRLGGHFVQGHVDSVGRVLDVRQDGFARRVQIAAEHDVIQYLVGKGSIAVDGVSLTVAEVADGSFTVSLIPETLNRTNLGQARPGQEVNLEVDLLAKYVEKLVRSR